MYSIFLPEAIQDRPDDQQFEETVTTVFSTFHQDLMALLFNSQMHIYLFALKDDNNTQNRFKTFYYADIFFDQSGNLLSLDDFKEIFNQRLMGTFYKVSVFIILISGYLKIVSTGLLSNPQRQEIISFSGEIDNGNQAR